MSLLKLKPSCKDYLWGGHRLVDEYGKDFKGNVLAETWELSCHSDGPSYIDNGPFKGKTLAEYIDIKGQDILGSNCKRFDDFPILIKFIDAKDNLSIQVHPNNQYALEHEHQYGKTEMWYVVDAKDDAFLYYGFKNKISKEEFKERIENNTLLDVLNKVNIKKGDVLFIESGTIHAIGKNTLIAEIQQNSNVTYRVYDYARVGPDGKQRALHIDKALDVTLLDKAKEYDFGSSLGISDYFKVDKINLQNEVFKTNVDDKSFYSILVLDGSALIKSCDEELSLTKGDSIFVEANTGDIEISGSLSALITTIPTKQYRIGVDIGGTDCKIGLVDNDNNIIYHTKIETKAQNGALFVIDNICNKVQEIIKENGFELSNCKGIGFGIPGLLDVYNGEILYSNNLAWEHVKIRDLVYKKLGLHAYIANDADAAAFGEFIAGAGKGYKSALMVTLGTGIGSGLIVDGKIYKGTCAGTIEFGHSLIEFNGRQCTCGRKGCLEAYASATALINEGKKIENIDNLNAKDIFDKAQAKDSRYQKVIDEYIEYLGAGLVNAINVYNPSVILLGGGVCAQKEKLTKPLDEIISKACFGAAYKELPKVLIATLGNKAGIIGAANLV